MLISRQKTISVISSLAGRQQSWITAKCWYHDERRFRHCIILASGRKMIRVPSLQNVDFRTRDDLGYCFMLMSGLDMVWVTALCWCQDSASFGLLHCVDFRAQGDSGYCTISIFGRKKIRVIALSWFQGAGWFWSLQNAGRISGHITIWVKKSLALCYNFRHSGKWNQISPLESACTLCQSWPPTSHAPQRRQIQLTGIIKLIICGAARRWTKVIAGTMTYTDYDDDVHSDWSTQRQRGYII